MGTTGQPFDSDCGQQRCTAVGGMALAASLPSYDQFGVGRGPAQQGESRRHAGSAVEALQPTRMKGLCALRS